MSWNDNGIFAPDDPALSPDRLLGSRHYSPRNSDMNFRHQYYHRLAGDRHRRTAMPQDDPFTSILRTRGMSVTNEEFSMDGSEDGRNSVNSSPSLRLHDPARRKEGDGPGRSQLLEEGGAAGDDGAEEKSQPLTWLKSVFNLANTSVGAGTLSLPFFYRSTGLVLGSIFLVIVALMSSYSLNLLAKLAQIEKGCTSYLTTAEVAYGHRGTKLVQTAMFMLTFGALTVYLIIIGSLSCQFLVGMVLENPFNKKSHSGKPSNLGPHGQGYLPVHPHNQGYQGLSNGSTPFGPGGNGTSPVQLTSQCASTQGLPFWCNRNFIVLCFLFFPMIPLSLKKNMKSLAFASILGLISVLYAVSMVAQDSIRHLVEPHPTIPLPGEKGGAKLFVVDMSIFFALPIVCLAYLNHPNIHATVEELENPTRKRVKSMVAGSTGLSTTLYLIMGMLGYMRFGNIVEDDILLNYINLNWTNTVLFNTCRVAMVMCLVVSYPLILFPCRMCLHALLKDALPESLKHFGGAFYFRMETFLIIGCAFTVSYFVPQIKTAFGLTGAITGCLMVYILPPLFYLKIRKESCTSSLTGFLSATLMVVGIIMSIVCTSAIVYQLVTGSG